MKPIPVTSTAKPLAFYYTGIKVQQSVDPTLTCTQRDYSINPEYSMNSVKNLRAEQCHVNAALIVQNSSVSVETY